MDESYFDFRQISEEKDELDFDNLTECPHCKKPIPEDSTLCLYCGKDPKVSAGKKWPIWVAMGLIVVFLLTIFFV